MWCGKSVLLIEIAILEVVARDITKGLEFLQFWKFVLFVEKVVVGSRIETPGSFQQFLWLRLRRLKTL
jgi:hypothetical protein